MRYLIRQLTTVAALIGLCGIAQAQKPGFDFSPKLPPGLGGSLGSDEPVTLSAVFEVAEGTDRGRVTVTAKMEEGWYVYSVTQAPGGPVKTTIEMADGSEAKLVGPFVPTKPPKKTSEEFWKDLVVEKHLEKVEWTAPIQFSDADRTESAKVSLRIDAQRCMTGKCVPVEETIDATLKGTYKVAKATGEFRDEGSVVTWNAWLEPSEGRPGDDARLKLVATVDDEYHVYHAKTTAEKFATVIVVTGKSGLRIGAPEASSAPIEHIVKPLPPVYFHESQVAWTLPIEIPKTAEPGEYLIEAFVGYQACTETSCLQRRAVRLSGTLVVGKDNNADPVPCAIVTASFKDVEAASAENEEWVDRLSSAPAVQAQQTGGGSAGSNYSVPVALAFGFLGGMILNLMPCVLPVIGLKIVSFVEQAGQDRRQVLTLNLWYSLGLLAVFWILAAIAIGLRASGESFAWGQQFTFFEFRYALMIFVFAMALSFLGTWEIPLPGFATGSKAGDLQKMEGASGAFAKGVFTTILATPCSGPFLGPVFAFMVAQPSIVVFSVFTAIGLGMAAPYLLIGAFPALIRFLPKPGEWMETMKQGLAFILLGTVVWMYVGTPDELKSPVFASLICVWFGCWLIGRVPNWESLEKRFKAWGTGVSVATVLSLAMFYAMSPSEIIDWEPYSEAKLAALQEEGKTVMIDFTADWCLTCQVNYSRVLNTQEMAGLVESHDIVPMIADWTDRNDEIRAKLTELNSESIPLLAIYPANDPSNPVVLPDLLTSAQVKSAIESISDQPAAAQASVEQTAMR